MISIIIPVYNSEKHLEQCLKSICNQTYRDLEIILVNDCSIDESLDICGRLASKDNRIKILNKQKNEGVEKARFDGLKVAKGQYVMFVDADDWLINADIVFKMYNAIETSTADYVEVGIQRVLDRFGIIKKKVRLEKIEISVKDLFEDYFISFFGVNILSVNIWGKLYRRSVIEKALMNPSGLFMSDDLAFNMHLFPYLDKIVLLDFYGYNYRYGGLTSKYNPHFIEDHKKLFHIKERAIDKYGYRKADKWIRFELKNILKTDICQRILYKKGSRNEIIEEIIKEIEDPIYDKLYDIDKSELFWEEPFVLALNNKDASQMYEICRKNVRKDRPRIFIKKLIYKILNLV